MNEVFFNQSVGISCLKTVLFPSRPGNRADEHGWSAQDLNPGYCETREAWANGRLRLEWAA